MATDGSRARDKPLPIEDCALSGDSRTAALIGREGQVDWLGLPRYDSPSSFGALLGGSEQGCWALAPSSDQATAERAYETDTFVLVTTWTTPTGTAEVIDLMSHVDGRTAVIRRVRGVRGRVAMHEEVRLRFEYAAALPWMRQLDPAAGPALLAMAGPDAVVLRGPRLKSDGLAHVADFEVGEGQTVDLTLTWFPSYSPPPPAADVEAHLESARKMWTRWVDGHPTPGPYAAAVRRSILMLGALTHADTGGIVAAATTSLPEQFGGARNWDYRYVWLRDASLTVRLLARHGRTELVDHWRQWLLRAVAGDPGDLQIMYGVAGERRLAEYEVTTLPGYDGAAPVRVGNGAYTQYQADVVGEVMVGLRAAREAGITESHNSWALQRSLMGYLQDNLDREDQGIWEARGAAHKYTQSRVMIWAALDCAAHAVRDAGLAGPVEEWERLRDQVRAEIEAPGFDTSRNTYTQYFGSGTVDASLLLLPQVGYCSPTDPRMLGTVAAIEQDLMVNGLPLRYRTQDSDDGLPAGENPFLACAFWLAEQYARSGRRPDAEALMDRLVGLCNDVGMLSEEYDVTHGRQAGNTPQALSHLALVRAAEALAGMPDKP